MTLIRTALDDKEYGWLRESSAVRELDRSARMLAGTLSTNFSGKEAESSPDERTRETWKRRFKHACQRLSDAGISTVPLPDGADR